MTRVIACAILVASLGLVALTAADAQNLRDAQTPAEFPPASFRGKQYVDSRGCIFIRAGIDGNVTWVPRVTRGRKAICGYKPTFPPGTATAAAPAPPPASPVQITLAPPAVAKPAPTPKPAPVRTTPVPARPAAPVKPTAASAPAPAPRTAVAAPASPILPGLFSNTGNKPSPGPEPTLFANPAKPKAASIPAAVAPSPYQPSPGPEPTLFSNRVKAKSVPSPFPTPGMATAPRAVAAPRAPSPAPAATLFSNKPSAPAPAPALAPPPASVKRVGACPGASALSRQFINNGTSYPVRCGPQADPPVTIRGRDSSMLLPAATAPTAPMVPVGTGDRMVPRHVYENRQNTLIATVPDGYRPAWDDNRLNPHRAERTAAPDAPGAGFVLPKGYRAAWGDGRLNPYRGNATADGDAQSDRIWQRTLPRRLRHISYDDTRAGQLPRARTPSRSRASQSAPAQPGKPRYVQVARYKTEAGARSVAKSLARAGLPVRFGKVVRRSETYPVVLAGPFTSRKDADAALARLRRAGYPRARILK